MVKSDSAHQAVTRPGKLFGKFGDASLQPKGVAEFDAARVRLFACGADLRPKGGATVASGGEG